MNEGIKLELWQRFCERYMCDNLGIPLFSVTEDRVVQVKEYGDNKRLILKRSEKMENFLIAEAEKVIDDHHRNSNIYDGLIYMMYKMRDGIIIPLYIGKAEKHGTKNDLSANLKGIGRGKLDRGKFCRWGDNYAYHIGNLSAVVCPNHPQKEIRGNYRTWANYLFDNYPTIEPKLKENVYFWIQAWKPQGLGIFPEFGCTPVTALEYQLISVAATISPESLLNQEGVIRRRQYIWFILFHLYSAILSQNSVYQ